MRHRRSAIAAASRCPKSCAVWRPAGPIRSGSIWRGCAIRCWGTCCTAAGWTPVPGARCCMRAPWASTIPSVAGPAHLRPICRTISAGSRTALSGNAMATTLIEPAPGLRGVTGAPWTGVRYFSTWRVGGVSAAPRDSLNLGTHVGDDPQAVQQNRQRLRCALPAEPLWLEQVHGTTVFDADARTDARAADPAARPAPCLDAGSGPARRADAAMTCQRGRPLVIMTADCVPVVLADGAGTVLGVAHAGWRGLAAGVLENTLDALRRRAPDAQDWHAWIGPGIGPDAF